MSTQLWKFWRHWYTQWRKQVTFYGEETTDLVQEAHSQAISDTSSGTTNTHLSRQSRRQHEKQGKLKADQKRSIFNKGLRHNAAKASSTLRFQMAKSWGVGWPRLGLTSREFSKMAHDGMISFSNYWFHWRNMKLSKSHWEERRKGQKLI